MRLFYLILYLIAFTIGGCFAFLNQNRFPPRTPKNLVLVQNHPASYPIDYVESVGKDDLVFVQGKNLFKTNCAACHNKNMKDHLTGPALGGVEARWAEYPKEDLFGWIRNTQAMIEKGHPRAKKLWEEWNKTTMTSFPNLDDEAITAILHFIDETYQ